MEVEVVEVDEVVDEDLVILVKTYLLMLQQIIALLLKKILITLIVLILLKYVHSNVILVILGIQQIVNVKRQRLKLLHEIQIL